MVIFQLSMCNGKTYFTNKIPLCTYLFQITFYIWRILRKATYSVHESTKNVRQAKWQKNYTLPFQFDVALLSMEKARCIVFGAHNDGMNVAQIQLASC